MNDVAGPDDLGRQSAMKKSSSSRSLRLQPNDALGGSNLPAGSALGASSDQPQQAPPRGRGREKSIMVHDLNADTLCPSRRDLYDPDAKGLQLLMQDSDMSMMGLSFSMGPGDARNGQPLRSMSPRRASPVRSGRSMDALEAFTEENEDEEDEEEMRAPKRDSHHENGSSHGRRDSNSSRKGGERMARRGSDRRLGMDDSSRRQRHRSKSPSSSRRHDLGGSSSSNHKRDSSSRRERRLSRSPSSRSNCSDKNDRRSSNGNSSSRHDTPHGHHGMDYGQFYKKVDRFVESVGNVHDDDFWVKMIDKWVESS